MKLLFFYMDGCQPCAEVKPGISKVVEELGIPVEWVDARQPENRPLLTEHNVRAVPHVVLLRGDEVLYRATGRLINPNSIKRFVGVSS